MQLNECCQEDGQVRSWNEVIEKKKKETMKNKQKTQLNVSSRWREKKTDLVAAATALSAQHCEPTVPAAALRRPLLAR